ncbi:MULTISPECIES: pyridoxamine 5'-phosphate oxidase family protein [Natronorubrum]|uniref:Flavin-nucleotide-binding protein-like protein n=2 Tax=Natronorubrum bangense TaxID=61858 RepID=L9WCI8_9EURY|nr:pyridoxamine 5'-phosphate oxidase family protein [Natronorubrum bangense]ELY47215.1 flavin-nucleotide-binding protein-like protein [Natronorubrum bangense JCM 10635]QCC53355.1 pyridoxamine 5'-phosphate oxidase family protein [Natronorubrum bangense]
MTGLRWVQLSAQERDEFLGTGGIGVLSFTRDGDEPPASLPVSYGYYDDAETFYFRLSFPPSSSKESFIDNPVSFVTYDETDEGWRSVVATGTLEELTELPHESAAVQGMWAVDIPAVEVFDRPRSEITFHDFQLEPDEISGRKETT